MTCQLERDGVVQYVSVEPLTGFGHVVMQSAMIHIVRTIDISTEISTAMCIAKAFWSTTQQQSGEPRRRSGSMARRVDRGARRKVAVSIITTNTLTTLA